MPNPFSGLAGLEMEVEDHGFDNPDDTWETVDKPHDTIRQLGSTGGKGNTDPRPDTCQTQARKTL